jgi:beta-glucosidase
MTDFVTTRPAPRTDPSWYSRFAAQLLQTQTLATFGGEVDLLLLGDSITESCAWTNEYQNHVKGKRVLYYGIGGDKTEHVLFRIENGICDGIRPKHATLLIGVNNFWPEPNVVEIAAGAVACGRALRRKLPDTALYHFGVFPLGSHVHHLNDRVDAINDRIASSAAEYGATFVSMRDAFLDAQGGEIPGMLVPDGVHLTGRAYDVWGESVKRLTTG